MSISRNFIKLWNVQLSKTEQLGEFLCPLLPGIIHDELLVKPAPKKLAIDSMKNNKDLAKSEKTFNLFMFNI